VRKLAGSNYGGRILKFIFQLSETFFFMICILYLFLACLTRGILLPAQEQEITELKIVHELFRLRNEHKADSAEQYYADTVRVYMKYLRNIPRKIITQSDKSFWRAHPKNKFEITAPVQIKVVSGISTATIIGKEYLDGEAFQYEKIEIKFDRDKKINSFRGFKWKKEK
jgi:hypothetical protein